MERFAVEQVTMLEFRRNAKAIIAKVRQGTHLVLTYRGKPAIRLEPIQGADADAGLLLNDPFYSLHSIAGCDSDHGAKEIDETVYGQ